ncbi:unnamed protein product [Didymodactylos carnosus]|uniref:Uncharacterized protein n=1 Tax=Didymodactylos carnosus TaxID=1234261 RepID=A0A815TCC0_9BILA|nr:unnamed protein product [Didymodactylos carnosus]CAF4362812.1 unnamed protein product [Didymodactylos carnosus]
MHRSAKTRYSAIVFLLFIGLLLDQNVVVQACSVIRMSPPEELVAKADVIVRANAASYEKEPAEAGYSTGFPTSIVKFEVKETLKGKNIAVEPLLIFGYLNNDDDYNDHPSPYTFVRRNGRGGSCFASTYKKGADFLLFLARKESGELTPYWSALAPVNEQLRPVNDEWLRWVKNQLGALRK